MLKRKARITIQAGEAGRTVLELLCTRFTYHSPDEWRALLAEGRILLNDAPATGREFLRPGDRLEYMPPDIPEPDVVRAFRIVWEDEDVLAVAKPGDLPCHPGGRFFNNTLWALLIEAGRRDFHILTRLDRETSGIVLIAKSRRAKRSLGRQMTARRIGKRYLAIVEGHFPDTEIEARGCLAPVARPELGCLCQFIREGASSPAQGIDDAVEGVTRFRLRRRFHDVSLVEAKPLTGRRHQIRATLKALGFPVVGDKLYGVDETAFARFVEGRLTAEDRRRLRLDRQALHALEVAFEHPVRGAMRLRVPLEKDLRDFLRQQRATRSSPDSYTYT